MPVKRCISAGLKTKYRDTIKRIIYRTEFERKVVSSAMNRTV